MVKKNKEKEEEKEEKKASVPSMFQSFHVPSFDAVAIFLASELKLREFTERYKIDIFKK